MMRYTQAGRPMPRPDSETGIHVDGPLQVKDWLDLLNDIAREMAEQATREGEARLQAPMWPESGAV